MTTTTTAAYSWKNEPELMERLAKAQNRTKNQCIDIMTYAGWAGSTEALRAHVEHYESN